MKKLFFLFFSQIFIFQAIAQQNQSIVQKPVTFAGFEDVELSETGFNNGSDKKGGFESGNFWFHNSFDETWGSWSGFAVSRKNDITTPGWVNQYSAITGMGVAGTPNYAVGYPVSASTITFKDTVVSGVYVTNSTYAYWSMKNGDAFSKKFGGESGNDKDWLILSIDGFNADNTKTGRVEFYLADFSYSKNEYDYIINFWKWVNLKPLGRISKLEFSLRSTDNGAWGMNTPGYFCIDKLNHEVTTSAPRNLNSQIAVFPNPFVDHLSISGIQSTATVTITDISGKIIQQYLNVNNHQVINDLNQLSNGIYLIKVQTAEQTVIQKLAKR